MNHCTLRVLALCLLLSICLLNGAWRAYAQTTNENSKPASRSGAAAQRSTSTGSLQGTIVDESGGIIPGAEVTIVDQNNKPQTVKSGSDGSYTFRRLAPGSYNIAVTAADLAQSQVTLVSVTAGKTATAKILMKPAALKEEVTVAEATNTQVNTDPSNNVSALVLKQEDLDSLPDDPDDLQADLEALAGPSAGPGGSQIFVDGFTGGRLPPKASIREVRINRNPFSAEYDKLGFGRIEILTKPGSDKFHGQAIYGISDGVWNSRNPFLTTNPDFRTQRIDANLSGPLSKKASFFMDFERRNIDNNGVIVATKLDDASLQPVPFNTFVPTPQRRTTFSPRVDYQLNQNHTLSFRYTYLDNDQSLEGVGLFNLASTGYQSTEKEQTAQITETAVLSPKAINETRFEYEHTNLNLLAASFEPMLNVQQSFVDGGSTRGASYNIDNDYEVQNYTTLSLGSHTTKFGARVRASTVTDSSPTNFNGTYTFNTLESYRLTLLGQQMGLTPAQIRAMGGGASQFAITGGNPRATVGQTDVGLFIQDDWRWRPNVTLSLGLRYETQTNISDRTNFAPRIGVAWAVHPKTVIRSGFGIFYDRFDSDYVLNAARYNGENQVLYRLNNPDTFPTVPPVTALPQIDTNSRQRYDVYRGLRAPSLMQAALGVDQQLAKNTAVSVNYTFSRGTHLLRLRNINAPLPGTYDPGVPGSGVRPYGDIGDLLLYEASGILNQHQIMVQLNSRVGNWLVLRGGYIFSNAKSDTDGVTALPANQYDLRGEYGTSSLNMRHRLFVMGSITGPWRLQFSPMIIANTGRPFNITSGQDLNGDGVFTDRPEVVTGPGQDIKEYNGVFLNPTTLAGTILPRNYGDGPSQFTVNLRVSKTWGFGTTKFAGPSGGASARGGGGGGGGPRGGMGGGGFGGGGMRGGGGRGGGGMDASTEHRYNVTFSVMARNVLNRVNYGPYVGNLISPLFGTANSIAGGFRAEDNPSNNRRIEMQLRFAF